MLVPVIAAALLLGSAASPTAAQRKAYNACLQEFMNKGLSEKMEEAAFDAALATACQAEAIALRTAAIAADLKAGRKKADSEEIIGADIEDYQLGIKDTFREFKKTTTPPPAVTPPAATPPKT